jgi:competence protein ComEC
MLGLGIATWFAVPVREGWWAALVLGVAVAGIGVSLGTGRRIGRALIWAGLAFSFGCGHVWWKAERSTATTLTRPLIATFEAEVRGIEAQPAKERTRLLLAPIAQPKLPALVRVSVREDHWRQEVATGQRLSVRARLMPPPSAALPGGFDFSRQAWFLGVGAVGTALEPVVIKNAVDNTQPNLRTRIARHIETRMDPRAAAIASALATGDQGAVSNEDQKALRASGLAHLLSISGLHITAVVAAAMVLALRLMALSPSLALRFRLPVVAAGFGAAAGIGYTLLTGGQVPTVRSCIAALLVLIALAMGREALTLRLVAAGALVVLLIWPEALVGPSFQLSFAAITALVALHELPVMQRMAQAHEAGWLARLARSISSLLLTGLAVEVALAPIALFHFHQSGLYGALANMIAIPLTTFVIMPAEALGLAFDAIGAGAPFWWVVEHAMQLLLALAHAVANMPGAVARLPSMSSGAFSLIVAGVLWLLLWRTPVRLAGLALMIVGMIWASTARTPDLLITGDGIHMAVRDAEGQLAILRPKAGDFVRNMFAEHGAYDAEDLAELDSVSTAQCSNDMCMVTLMKTGRSWTVAATRSRHYLDWRDVVRICAMADIVVSDRSLPRSCTPRWIKADRPSLLQTGGLSIWLDDARVSTVRKPRDDHPWAIAALASGQ